jgi:hypothetical protein
LNNIVIPHDKLLLMDYTEILSPYMLGGTEEMPKKPQDRQDGCE